MKRTVDFCNSICYNESVSGRINRNGGLENEMEI